MAVFFKYPAPPGVVVRAEHLFARCTTRAPLVRAWKTGLDGRPTGEWTAAAVSAEPSAEDPLPSVFAA